jgi:hypothetical protein
MLLMQMEKEEALSQERSAYETESSASGEYGLVNTFEEEMVNPFFFKTAWILECKGQCSVNGEHDKNKDADEDNN